jgi:FAD synthase
VEVSFRAFLRPERKFANLEELRAQIARDAAQAREMRR